MKESGAWPSFSFHPLHPVFGNHDLGLRKLFKECILRRGIQFNKLLTLFNDAIPVIVYFSVHLNPNLQPLQLHLVPCS